MKLSYLNQRLLFGADMLMGDFLRETDLCFLIKNEIEPIIRVEDFEGMYNEGGRNPVSPKTLLLVLIMQYLEGLSDRAAALNLRYRLDWKIAFGLELDFEGIHPTTLVYFRNRLLDNGMASYAFDTILKHLVDQGHIKKSSKQRIDSTHVVGKVRELSRLELLHETLRLFCVDIEKHSRNFDSRLKELHELYIEKISTRGITDVQKKKFGREAGLAMMTLISWSEASPIEWKIPNLKSFATLKTVFAQNYEDAGQDKKPELKKISNGKGHISSPHEPEAEFSSKGPGTEWIGYKAQVAETIPDGEDDIGFITHIEVTGATDYDGETTIPFIEACEEKGISPSEVFGDTHYNSAQNIKDSGERGVDLKGPVGPAPKKKAAEKNLGFKIDLEKCRVVCPAGSESKRFTILKSGRVDASFEKEACLDCHRKNICEPEQRGKQIEIRPVDPVLTARREEMTTEEFKEDMHKRNGVEGTISGLVRGQGMRVSRYRGKKKNQLQLKLIGAAANLKRLNRKHAKAAQKIQEIEPKSTLKAS